MGSLRARLRNPAAGRELTSLAFMFVVATSLNGARPTISYRALELGAGAALLGVVSAAYASLALVGGVPIGKGLDRFGPRPFLVGSACLLLVSLGVAAVSANIVMVAAAHALMGLGQIGAAVATQTIMAGAGPPETRDSRFGRLTVVVSVGGFIGPLAAGGVMDADGLVPALPRTTVAFLAAALLMTLTLVIAVAFALLTRGEGRPARKSREERSGFTRIARRRGMPEALFASLTVLVATDIIVMYLPALGEARGIPSSVVGALLSIRSAAMVLSRLSMPLMLRWLGRRRLLMGSMALGAAGLVGLALSTATWQMAAVTFLTGLGLGIGTPMTVSWVAGIAPPGERGTALALRLSSNRGAQVTVPPLLGALAGVLGLGTVFVAAGALLLAGGQWVRRGDLD